MLVRQRGYKWHSGNNTVKGLDHTIHARVEGRVHFRKGDWRKRGFYWVDVIPEELPNRLSKPPSPYNYHPELFPERAKLNHPPLKMVRKNWAVID